MNEDIQNILSHFRRDLDGDWICKYPLRLTTATGDSQSLREGTIITKNAYCYYGVELTTTLDHFSLIYGEPGPADAVSRQRELDAMRAERSRTRTTRKVDSSNNFDVSLFLRAAR